MFMTVLTSTRWLPSISQVRSIWMLPVYQSNEQCKVWSNCSYQSYGWVFALGHPYGGHGIMKQEVFNVYPVRSPPSAFSKFFCFLSVQLCDWLSPLPKLKCLKLWKGFASFQRVKTRLGWNLGHFWLVGWQKQMFGCEEVCWHRQEPPPIRHLSSVHWSSSQTSSSSSSSTSSSSSGAPSHPSTFFSALPHHHHLHQRWAWSLPDRCTLG